MTAALPHLRHLRHLALLAAIAFCGLVRADGGLRLPEPGAGAYRQECAACHVAYPPGLLPSASWRRTLGKLDAHHGVDASMDPVAVRQIGQWLERHAGTHKAARSEPPEDRITRSVWFVRKHDSIDAATWALPSVKSRANCVACHGAADRGLFDDDDLRLPAGLSPAQRRRWQD